MLRKFILIVLVILKLENSKVKKNNLFFIFLFVVVFLEIILPEYAKMGIAVWQKKQFNNKARFQKSNNTVRSFAHHDIQIVSDPWFFQMVKNWRKTDRFFVQKWRKALQPWTYKDMPSRVVERERQRLNRLWKTNKAPTKAFIKKKLSHRFFKKKKILPTQIIFAKKPLGPNLEIFHSSFGKLFFNRADLLNFSFNSLGDGLKKLLLANTGELILGQRCRWIVTEKKIKLSSTPVGSAKFCYWNLDILIKSLQMRPDFMQPAALFRLEAMLDWYSPDIFKKVADISYEESILWFKTHPVFLLDSKLLPVEISALVSTPPNIVLADRLKNLSVERIKKIFFKKQYFMNSKFFKKLGRVLKKKIGLLFRNVACTDRLLTWLEKTVRTKLVSNFILCLALYPELLVQSQTVVLNIVMRYSLAELNRTNQLLKYMLNYLRLTYLVKSVREINNQLYRNVIPSYLAYYTSRSPRVIKRRRYLEAIDEFLLQHTEFFYLTENCLDSFFFVKSVLKSLYWPKDIILMHNFNIFFSFKAVREVNFLERRTLLDWWSKLKAHINILKQVCASSVVFFRYLRLVDFYFIYNKWDKGVKKYEVRRYPNRVWDLRTFWRLDVCTQTSKKYYFKFIRAERQRRRQMRTQKKHYKIFVKNRLRNKNVLSYKRKIIRRRFLLKKVRIPYKKTNKVVAGFKKNLERVAKKLVRRLKKKNRPYKMKQTKKVIKKKKIKHTLFRLKKINNWELVRQKNKSMHPRNVKVSQWKYHYFKTFGFWFLKRLKLKRFVLSRKGKKKNQELFKSKTSQFFQVTRVYKKMFIKSNLTSKPFIYKTTVSDKKIIALRSLFGDLFGINSLSFFSNKVWSRLAASRKELIREKLQINFSRKKSFLQLQKLISSVFSGRRKFFRQQAAKKKIVSYSGKKRQSFLQQNFKNFLKNRFLKNSRKIKIFKSLKVNKYRFLQKRLLQRGLFKKIGLKSFLEFYSHVYWQLFQVYHIKARKKKHLKLVRIRSIKYRRRHRRLRFFTPVQYFKRLMFYFLYRKQKGRVRYRRFPWKKKRRIFRRNRFKKVFVKMRRFRKRFFFIKKLKMSVALQAHVGFSVKSRELADLVLSSKKSFKSDFFYHYPRANFSKKSFKKVFMPLKPTFYTVVGVGAQLNEIAVNNTKYSIFFANLNKIFLMFLQSRPRKYRIFGKKIIPIVSIFSTEWIKYKYRKKQIFKKGWLKKRFYKLRGLYRLFMQNYKFSRAARPFSFSFAKLSVKPPFFHLQFLWKYVKQVEKKKNFFFKYSNVNFLSQVLVPLWKDVFSKEHQEEMSMINIFSSLPGLYIFNSRFSTVLFSSYLQNLNQQKNSIFKNGFDMLMLHYKKILKQYIFLLRLFYKNYYSVKKSKALPSHYGIYLVYKYLYLTAQVDLAYLSRRRDRSARLLKLVSVSRYINRKGLGVIRKKKNLFKLNTLFDRLFFWLYRASNISYIISQKIKKAHFNLSSEMPQFVYRKRVKFIV